MVAVDAAITRLQRQCRSAVKASRCFVSPTAINARCVTFVAGQQRSGTNMLMDVLDRHWRTQVYHETDPRAFQQYQMRDIATIRALVDGSRAGHVVIKALCELQRLRSLLDAFPNSKAVWLVRHYHDVSESMARQFSSTAKVLRQMRRDPALGGWRGESMSSSIKTLLVECIDDDTTEVSAAAFQWFMRNQLYFDQALEQDRRVKIVFYEDLVTKPKVTFKSVLTFLGIDFRPSLIADVFASSVDKADKPPVDPRIDALCHQLFDDLVAAAQTQH